YEISPSHTNGQLPRARVNGPVDVAAPKMVRARRPTRAKSPRPADAPMRNAANAPAPRMSPFGSGASWLRAAARQSAAPHRNSPKTRVSAGAPTQVFKFHSAIAKIKAVAARAATAIKNAILRTRTHIKAGASSGNSR